MLTMEMTILVERRGRFACVTLNYCGGIIGIQGGVEGERDGTF